MNTTTTKAEAQEYASADNCAAIDQIPDAAWTAVLAATAALCEHVEDPTPGVDCDVAITRETLENFANSRANHWRERGQTEDLESGQIYRNIQIAKGARRQDIAILDRGDLRVVLTA